MLILNLVDRVLGRNVAACFGTMGDVMADLLSKQQAMRTTTHASQKLALVRTATQILVSNVRTVVIATSINALSALCLLRRATLFCTELQPLYTLYIYHLTLQLRLFTSYLFELREV